MEPKDEIKERLDVAEIISGYIELRPAGMNGFKAICPFHSEKTPSLHVSKEKQIWHCFGCHKGGDIFSFVMDMEGMSFVEALKQLAQKAGVELPEKSFRGQDKKKHDVLFEANELATRFYQAILAKHDSAKDAREYLDNRGIDSDLITKFKLGFAPEGWDTFIAFARKRGLLPERLEKAGLAKKRRNGSGHIDQFRGRIMVPIMNGAGAVVGFTGRILKGEGPKYVNTPETPIYQKRDLLYGLHLAKTAIRMNDAVIVVEGNLDVIASHKAGIEHVVASSGTALTELQVSSLKKLTKNIIFSFDSDNAGFQAANRGIQIALKSGMNVSVVRIPDELGKDPDDVVQRDPKAWANLVSKPVHIMDFYIEYAFKMNDIQTVQGKKGFSDFVLKEISRIDHAVEREHWLQKIADILHMDINVLRRELGQPERKTPQMVQKAEIPKKKSKIEKALATVMGMFIVFSEMREEIASSGIQMDALPENWANVYKKIISRYTASNTTSSAKTNQLDDYGALLAFVGEENEPLIRSAILEAEQMLEGNGHEYVRSELRRYIQVILNIQSTKQRLRIEADIRNAESSGDEEKLRQLLDAYQQIIKG